MMKVYNAYTFTSNVQLVAVLKLFQVINKHDRKKNALKLTLNELLLILPEAMREKEQILFKIVIPDFTLSSPSYKTNSKSLQEELFINDGHIGYIEATSKNINHEFSAEDRIFILTVSNIISRMAERLKNKEQLETDKLALKNSNITLHEVLNRVQLEKDKIAQDIKLNINKIISPVLKELSKTVSPTSKKYIELIEMGLTDIFSPYISKLSDDFMSLTPQEIMLCNLIRSELSSKDIAELKNISVATVNTHRNNIRNKLGIKNMQINLKSYLINNLGDSSEYQ